MHDVGYRPSFLAFVDDRLRLVMRYDGEHTLSSYYKETLWIKLGDLPVCKQRRACPAREYWLHDHILPNQDQAR